MLETLRRNNPGLGLYRVADAEFSEYGRVPAAPDLTELTDRAKRIARPPEGSRYDSSVPELEGCAVVSWLREDVFGGMPIETGCCRGYNERLDALEWHKSSEIDIAVTPLVLLLGRLPDIRGGVYDSARVRGFLMEPGQCVELYATTLHFCPCQVTPDGFACVVVLPRGTNLPLDEPPKDPLLFRKNKWLIAHGQNTGLIDRGAQSGITGENWRIAGV